MGTQNMVRIKVVEARQLSEKSLSVESYLASKKKAAKGKQQNVVRR